MPVQVSSCSLAVGTGALGVVSVSGEISIGVASEEVASFGAWTSGVQMGLNVIPWDSITFSMVATSVLRLATCCDSSWIDS